MERIGKQGFVTEFEALSLHFPRGYKEIVGKATVTVVGLRTDTRRRKIPNANIERYRYTVCRFLIFVSSNTIHCELRELSKKKKLA